MVESCAHHSQGGDQGFKSPMPYQPDEERKRHSETTDGLLVLLDYPTGAAIGPLTFRQLH